MSQYAHSYLTSGEDNSPLTSKSDNRHAGDTVEEKPNSPLTQQDPCVPPSNFNKSSLDPTSRPNCIDTTLRDTLPPFDSENISSPPGTTAEATGLENDQESCKDASDVTSVSEDDDSNVDLSDSSMCLPTNGDHMSHENVDRSEQRDLNHRLSGDILLPPDGSGEIQLCPFSEIDWTNYKSIIILRRLPRFTTVDWLYNYLRLSNLTFQM